VPSRPWLQQKRIFRPTSTIHRDVNIVITYSLFKHNFKDLLSKTAQFAQLPELELGIDIEFLFEEIGEGDLDEDGGDLEEVNFDDPDYMSNEAPIYIAPSNPQQQPQPQQQQKQNKRKEPEGEKQLPPHKKPRQ